MTTDNTTGASQSDSNADNDSRLATEFTVEFKNTGEKVKAKRGARLMEVTTAEGWPIAYGCEDGMCGTCLTKVRGGVSPKESKEIATLEVMGLNEGEYRLACQCKVEGDCEIEQ